MRRKCRLEKEAQHYVQYGSYLALTHHQKPMKDPNLQYNINIKRSIKYAYFQRKFICFTETYARDTGQFVLDTSAEDNGIVLSHLIN